MYQALIIILNNFTEVQNIIIYLKPVIYIFYVKNLIICKILELKNTDYFITI